MLLLLIVLLQVLSAIFWLSTPLWLFYLFWLVVYGSLYYYLDDSHVRGQRALEWFRNWRFWQSISPVHYTYTLAEAIKKLQKPCVFVVMPNATNMALVYGFGFHGGALPLPNTRRGEPRPCVYLLPPLLFRIPYLRDLLLWSGAIANYGYDTILDHVNAGHCVAYSPGGMADLFHLEPNKLVFKQPETRVFEFAKENSIHLVPVLVYNELERYHIYQSAQRQQHTYNMTGWPFPFWVFPRVFGQAPPPPLHLYVGNPLNPAIHDTVDGFAKMFIESIKGMNNCGSDRELVIKE